MRTKSFLPHFFLLAWLAVCLAYFVVVSRVDYLHLSTLPGWPLLLVSLGRIAPAKYLFDLLYALGGVFLFSLACLSLGLGLLKGQVKTEPKLAIFVTAFVLGGIACSLTFLLLINFRWLTPVAIGAALLAGFLSGLPALRAWLRDLPRPALPTDFRRWEHLLLGLLGGIFVLGLLSSSARFGYDAVVEYFTHAKIMAVSQRPIFLYFSDPFLVSSFHSTILFTSIIQLFGDQAARMLSWMNGLAILLIGLALGKELGLTPRARLYFLALMLTSTAFVDLLGDGKVELITTAPILAAIYWMLRSIKQPSKGNFILIGTLAGFAIIARPYNIFLVSIFVTLFYLNQMRLQFQAGGFRFWQFVRPILWMFPPLILLGAFHLWQNWLWLGSPIAPLTYARSLGSDDWQWQFDPNTLNTLRLLYPLTVTFMNSPQSLGNISPFFVGMLPFLLLGKVRAHFKPSVPLSVLLLPTLITLALWVAFFFTVVEIRYVFFLWVVLFLCAAPVVEATLGVLNQTYQNLLQSSLALLLAFIAVRVLAVSLATYSPLDASGQAHCHDLSFCAFLEPLNQTVAQGERVFVLNAYRYYLRPDLFACSSQAQEYAPLQALINDPDGAFWIELYRQGFHYLTYEKNFTEFHSRFGAIPSPESAPDWLKITVISSTQNEAVYQVQPSNPPFSPLTTCLRAENGSWAVTTSEKGE